MSQFKTKYIPNLFEMGGAFTKPFNRSDAAMDRTNNYNGVYQVQESMKQIQALFQSRTFNPGPDSWPAIVLHVEETTTSPSKMGKIWPLNHYVAQPTPSPTYIKIWARRDPEDQSIPQPDLSYLKAEWKNPQRSLIVDDDKGRMAIVKMHPSYTVSGDTWGSRRLPKPMDTVRVTFDDKPNQARGRLLDFFDGAAAGGERGIATPVTATGGTSPASAATAFADVSRPISTVFKEDLGPQIVPPTQEQLEEAIAIRDKMCPGPDVSRPNNLEFKQNATIYGGAKVQTIIWNGRIVYRETAPYAIAMFLAAKREAGITLVLTSEMRSMGDNVEGKLLEPFLFDEYSVDEDGNKASLGCSTNFGEPYSDYFLNKVKTGPTTNFSSGQSALRRKHCTPVEQALTTNCTCSPDTSFPTYSSKSAYGHGSGYAYDVSSGMGNVGAVVQANITKQYRWMCLNAWKFGFVRNVRSERWHWELRITHNPRPHMFTFVKRTHGTWDNQFISSNYKSEMDLSLETDRAEDTTAETGATQSTAA